ncbi:hypothetical protein J437_LFUL004132 [Ladona fulva]|uniref:Uncharacterized protein n=1 Tax=Ladona fulva TaxID=123851 RepID=A0A8K0NXU6_LADFU|nr:hypothetical protein J437_LFUL004132 [Ladona fulva]
MDETVQYVISEDLNACQDFLEELEGILESSSPLGNLRPFKVFNRAFSSLYEIKNELRKISCPLQWVGKCLIRSNIEKESKILNQTENMVQLHSDLLKKCHDAISSLDTKEVLILNIMDEIAKKVRASKVKMFLCPAKNEFIWPPEFCDVYEIGERSNRWQKERKARKTIEFSKETDMAWYTVKNNSLINLMSNLSDARLDRKMDLKYGLHIRNMISFPIHVREEVAGMPSADGRKEDRRKANATSAIRDGAP